MQLLNQSLRGRNWEDQRSIIIKHHTYFCDSLARFLYWPIPEEKKTTGTANQLLALNTMVVVALKDIANIYYNN